jgi:peptidoglycan/LPS O-acetylase OafA/YrhL
MSEQYSKLLESKRIFGLDLFRALAILFVVIGHGNIIFHKVLPGFPYVPLPDGVELFFVLSGFLIGQIVIKALIQFREENYSWSTLMIFWKRRWFRTLPNYYLALLLNIVVTYFLLNSNEIEYFNWKFFFFLQNFQAPFYGFFWESWSLSIEEWFYILYPLAIFLSAYIFKKWKIKKLLFTVTAIFIILPLLYKIYMANLHHVDNFWWDVQFRKTVLTRLDTVIWGVLMALIYVYYEKVFRLIRWPAFAIGLALLIFNMLSSYDADTLYMKSFYFVVNSLGAALLLPLLNSWKTSKQTLVVRTFTRISIISYAIYVLHFGLILQVIATQFPSEDKIHNTMMYLLYLGLTFALSEILYRFYEKPFTNLRPKAKG